MRFRRKWIRFCLVLCVFGVAFSFCQPASSPAATMHVILAGDTNDPDIGESVQQDLNNMTKLFETISNKTGMDYAGFSLDGDGLTSSGLDKAMTKLEVSADDVIFFYYSGHGGRYQATETKWPLLKFQDGLVEFQQVLDTLSAMRPRLLIALADCCNSYIDEASFRQNLKQFEKAAPSAESYKKLFLYQQGHYIASGSIPGEPSIALQDGGMFTSNFLAKLESEAASGNPDWRNIRATVLAAPNGEEQHPQYEIEIEAATEGSSAPIAPPAPAQPVAPARPARIEPPPPAPARPPRMQPPTPIPTQPPTLAQLPALGQLPGRMRRGTNLLRNGDFRQNTQYWNFRASNWLVKNLNGRIVLATNDANQRFESPSVSQDVANLPKGRTYTFEATLCSPTLPRQITMVIWEIGERAPIQQMQTQVLTQECQRLSVSHPKQADNTLLRVEIYYESGSPPEDIYLSDAWLQ